jgi:hypothetical protein
MDIEEVRKMRKGIMSLSLPGMKKGSGKRKTGNMVNAEQAAERKAAAHEEPKVEAKGEKQFVQTINIPKPHTTARGNRRRGILGGRPARRTEEKK